MSTEKICETCGCVIENESFLELDGKYYCADCIKNGEVEGYTVCDECGEILTEESCVTVNPGTDGERKLCGRCCENTALYACDECGELFETEFIKRGDGIAVCEECFDNRGYYLCEDCGAPIPCGEGYVINEDYNSEKWVCEECASNYSRCDECGNYFSGSYINTDDYGHYYCDDCMDSNDINRCDSCNELLASNHQFWCGDVCYCEQCYDSTRRNTINNYSYKPDPNFYCCDGENTKEYFGIELEVDNGHGADETAEQVIEEMTWSDDAHVYCKKDGSLNSGFEIVSHPCTLEYHTRYMEWENVMQICIENGFRSHDARTCGLHIHIDRDTFGITADEQDLNIAKLIMLIDKFWVKVVKFSRRAQDQLSRWAAQNNIEISEYDLTNEIKDKMKNQKSAGRYHAVNLSNENTVEIRLFRGTLRYKTFIATLQFTATLVRYAKQVTLTDIWRTTWDDVFYNTEYEELREYLKERGLLSEPADTSSTDEEEKEEI